jgi:oligoribonuclease NrnB/cAMP/cGMP phosphodiesterase (DHH superfamily)
MKRIAVIFHKNCPDGYGALAGVVYKYGIKNLFYDEENDIIYNYDNSFVAIPTNHSTDFSRLKELLTRYIQDKWLIYMVDIFVPKIYEVVREYPNVEKVIVIDHHKTAKEVLEQGIPDEVRDKFEIHLDMDKSGATLTWKILNGFEPEIMKYIEDRDIWKWEIPDSIYVLTAIDAKVFNVLKPHEIVQKLLELVENFPKEELAEEGSSMIEFKEAIVQRLVNNNTHYILLPSGHKLIAINSPVFQSDIGNRLAQLYPEGVACVYSISPKEDDVYVNCSIRSINGKAREIAQANGGGGHDNAAGCRVPLKLVKFEPLNQPKEEKNG